MHPLVAQAGFRLTVILSQPPSAGVTVVSHCAWPEAALNMKITKYCRKEICTKRGVCGDHWWVQVGEAVMDTEETVSHRTLANRIRHCFKMETVTN